MLIALLERTAVLLRKIAPWTLVSWCVALPMGFLPATKTLFTLAIAGFCLPGVVLLLWVITSLIVMVLRRIDLISTYPAVGEVISSDFTGQTVNDVPEYAVKMRIIGTDIVTECRVLSFLGSDVGGQYNIRVSRLNPAVAKLVESH
jgi:hypothetical protein